MKKVISFFILVFMGINIFTITATATTVNNDLNDIRIENNDLNNTLAEGESVYYDGAKELEEITKNTINRQRMDGEEWKLIENKKLESNILLDATVMGGLVNPGVTSSKTVGMSVGFGSIIKTYTIDVGFSVSITKGFTAVREKLADNTSKNSTHQVQVGYVRGDIFRQVYKVYNKYSGNYVRTVTQIVAIREQVTACTINISDEAGGLYASNIGKTKYKKFSKFSDYKNKVNSSSTMFTSLEF